MRVYPRKKKEMTRADNDNNKVMLVMSDTRLLWFYRLYCWHDNSESYVQKRTSEAVSLLLCLVVGAEAADLVFFASERSPELNGNLGVFSL